jgi:RNA polymerase sigma-70 factor (ECF subfamily)
MNDTTPDRAAEDVARSSYGRLLAYLAARAGDVASAEDALGDAFVEALRTWPRDGVPERPEAWLLTVARRRLVDDVRKGETRARITCELKALAEADGAVAPGIERAPLTAVVPDDRLALLFVCAHPAIDPRMHAPLMLQTVLGLDAARIASAFLVAPTTIGQRLVRAKAKIRDARIAFRVPESDDLPPRLGAVLEGIYAAFGTGWDDAAGLDVGRVGLTDEAIRLARLVTSLLPDEPEAHGLLALVLHCDARRDARRADDGSFVPLSEQDVSRWSREQIAEAERHLRHAATFRRLGRFQLEAAIQSVHARRADTRVTDWQAIDALYDGLTSVAPTIGAFVAAAAAASEAHGPEEGLRRLDGLPERLTRAYQPYWVLRARLLQRCDRVPEATAALRRALGLTEDPAVRTFLAAQLP